MSRWHKAACTNPDVFVDASSKTPQCRSCAVVAPIHDIVANHATNQQLLEVPPDEPAGQLALWWPPSVRYSSRHGGAPHGAPGNQEPTIKKATPLRKTRHPVYDTALSAEEFRLVRFDAPTASDHPIHITLEVFRRDDCPEYETVSYTWGGEEGDSTPCRPVFVGPYWDLLLQTQNCHDLLLYLRPKQGIRMVWIDALCINQGDPDERSLQVSKMRNIYQECSRVVVFLGADLIKVGAAARGKDSRAYPARHALQDFDRVIDNNAVGGLGPGTTFLDLLSRRYFSRVWASRRMGSTGMLGFADGYNAYLSRMKLRRFCLREIREATYPNFGYLRGRKFGVKRE